MKLKEKLLEQLKIEIEEQGISQSELARRADVKRQYINSLLNGNEKYTSDQIEILLSKVHVGIDVKFYQKQVNT